jgi:hypothetical protein
MRQSFFHSENSNSNPAQHKKPPAANFPMAFARQTSPPPVIPITLLMDVFCPDSVKEIYPVFYPIASLNIRRLPEFCPV